MKSLYILLVTLIFCVSTLQSQSAWTTVATTTDDLQTICFIDSLTGWVGGSNGTQGVIRKTTDGGNTWSNQGIPVTNTITKIIFLDSLVGFASGANGTVLKTTDRGHTWSVRSTGTVDNLTSVFFLNRRLGWTSGYTTALFTKDGGETWSSRPTPGATHNFDIAFKDSLEGMVVGADGHCYKTTDGGNTWVGMWQAPVGGVSYFCVCYLSPTQVLVAGGSNIGQSDDGGLTWWSRLVGYDGQVNGISFGNSQIGWAASAIRIFKSTNGGKIWIPQPIPPGSGYLRAIHTPDGVHAWAIGEKKILANRPGTPSAAQSTISANPISIRVDGKSSSTITVQIKDSEGTNFTSSAGSVELNTTAGTLGNVSDMLNGTYSAVLTSSRTVESAVITGKLHGDSIGSVIKVGILDAAPSLSLSTISVSSAKLFTDGQGTATITVQVKYSDSVNFTSSAGVVALKTTAGSLNSLSDHNNGSYTAVFSTPPISGVATITATLDGIPLTGSATIQLIKGGPNLALSTISVALISVSSDHVAKDSIRVQIKDTVGNNYRTSAGTLLMRTTAGMLGTVADNHDGSYTAELTLSADESQAVVTAELEGAPLSASVTVMNDWRTFPMEIGDKWFYKYVHYPTVYNINAKESGFVVRTITASALNGEKTVSVATNYFNGNKSTNLVEYWTYQNGKFFLIGDTHLSSDPIYIASLKQDSLARLDPATGRNYYLLQNEYFGNQYACQRYVYGHYWSGAGTSHERIMAKGLGLVFLSDGSVYMSTSSRDSAILIGALLSGVLIGDSVYTIAPPLIPISLFTPTDRQTDVPEQITFRWGKTGAEYYRLQISTDSLFTTFVFNDSTLTDTSKIITGLKYLAHFYWRVQALPKNSPAYWSQVWSFFTARPKSVPMEFALHQNYPNPFNPSTTISFSLPSRAFVSLNVYDVLGKDVIMIVSEELPVGNYSRQWNGAGYPSGVYFYRMKAGTYMETRSLILMK